MSLDLLHILLATITDWRRSQIVDDHSRGDRKLLQALKENGVRKYRYDETSAISTIEQKSRPDVIVNK